MKTLRLDCEELEIESFRTAPASADVGTIRAQEATLLLDLCGKTYDDTLCGISRGC